MTALGRFLRPDSIAVIGASPDPAKIRGRLIKVLCQNGYGGTIYPVNPSYAELDGRRCFPDPAAIGAPVDLALIAVPAPAVLAALEACAAAGVGNAVVISSGFAEDSAAPPDLQAKIGALARSSLMRICGPNSEGFHNQVDRVTVTFSPAVESELEPFPALSGPLVGVVAQSGGMGFALFNRGRALGLPFSAVITTGNEADLTLADFFAHLAADDATRGILLFLETVRDPAAFRRAAATAAAAGKPVVAIKVGSSGAGRAAAASHTASLTGWDAAYRALFRRYGVVPATDLDDALAAMAGLLTNPRAAGRRVGLITVSGGAGALAADALSAAGLELPELSAASQAAIRTFIPTYGATRNPVDITAQGAGGGGTLRAAELLLADHAIDQIALVISLANTTKVPLEAADLAKLLARREKPILVASYTIPSPLAQRELGEAGAVVFRSLALLGTAAAALATPAGSEPPPPRPLPATLEGAGVQTEHAAKAALAACGIAIAPSVLVRDEAELAPAVELLGFPLALKIQSPDIPHKTEAGGVRLRIADVDALRAARRDMLATVRRHRPDARIDGVLLERMAAPGIEMVVGTVRDPVAGPVVTVGFGGTAAEAIRDVAHRLAPLDEAEAADMIRSLRGAALLDGWRGAPPADIPSLAVLVSRLSHLAADGADRIAELECNPVIAHALGEGCTVADALLVLAPPHRTEDPA